MAWFPAPYLENLEDEEDEEEVHGTPSRGIRTEINILTTLVDELEEIIPKVLYASHRDVLHSCQELQFQHSG